MKMSPSVSVRGEEIQVEDGTLNLSGKGLTSLDEVKGWESIHELESLILNNNKFQYIPFNPALSNLRFLYLDSNNITKIGDCKEYTNLGHLWLA